MKLFGKDRNNKTPAAAAPVSVTEEDLADLSGRMNDLETALEHTRTQLTEDQKKVEELRAKKMTRKATVITALVLFVLGLILGLIIAARA